MLTGWVRPSGRWCFSGGSFFAIRTHRSFEYLSERGAGRVVRALKNGLGRDSSVLAQSAGNPYSADDDSIERAGRSCGSCEGG